MGTLSKQDRLAGSTRWFIADTLTRLAPRAGASIELELRFCFVGVEALDTIHPGFVTLAVAITAEMGLRLCGVDLLLRAGSLADPPADYVIIEINAAPGLDNYAASGALQARRVDELYLAVLKALRQR